MPQPKLKKGQRVFAFTDPISQKELEGKVLLRKFIRASGEPTEPTYMEFWAVTFLRDDHRCDRWIMPPNR